MKLSKFLKDILFTSFSQALALLLGVAFLKCSALLLNPEHFGLLTLFRRWVAVFIPIFSLNVGLSLTRFVSFDKERRDHYLKLASAISNLACLLAFAAAIAAPQTISSLLFDRPGFSILVVILAFFLYVNIVQINIYSYYRGMQRMGAANLINIAFFILPVLTAAALLLSPPAAQQTRLTIMYAVCTFPVLLSFVIYLIRRRSFSFTYPFRLKATEIRTFIGYGAGRLPSAFFLSILLGIPVIFAKGVSLEYAGMVGIFVNVLRLLEIFSEPFNKIFLPKFSELKGEGMEEHIRQRCLILLEFMIAFFPVIVALTHGLARHIVLFWFSAQYLSAVPGVRISILFSLFYLVYAMLRGVLNGLFTFPHVNVICFLGVAISGAATFTFLNKNIRELALSFGLGLAALGISSTLILVKKIRLPFPWKSLLSGAASAILLFAACSWADLKIQTFSFPNIYFEFAALAAYRSGLLCAVFWFLWKKSRWFRELKKRMNIAAPATQEIR